ncbi:MAG: DNA mismatch repair endonuclease MutL [Crocinitomicaceae bacterium]|jgi:DNA mismatch repair protein MutL
MSDIIKLLPDHIANQIAAGEVIQRPASVVKELVENAIDANANSIDVVIKNAGRTLIQVIDNGFGMSEIDARMAFERHATSKVQSADDLFALKTKGFRGEALASIAAIAHVQLHTKQEKNELGTLIEIEGSKLINNEQIASKNGTSFSVKNLFYNVPARRNFLKSDAVEFGHIEEEFIRIALAHPELSFSLYHNDSLCYKLSNGNLRKRIVDLFGKNINDKLIQIEETTDIVKITGFVGKPEGAKKTRGEQYLFVNNRYFKDMYFNHAINSAYDNLILPKTFVPYFLFFEVKPSSIDVNVHPTKTEIKFEEDKEIYAILKSTIKLGLGKFNISPSLDFEAETSFDIPYEMYKSTPVEPQITVNPNYNPFNNQSTTSSSLSYVKSGMSNAIKSAGFSNNEFNKSDWENFYDIKTENESFQSQIDIPKNTTSNEFILKENYIITSTKSGLLFIHYKRAKQRIVYDEIMQTFVYNPLHSQQLLFPISFNCNKKIQLLWDENRTTIERMGFMWNNIDEGLEITGTPAELELETVEDAIDSISQNLSLETFDKSELAHIIALNISISVSRKKITFSKEIIDNLIERLFQSSEHQYAPNGKLIMETKSLEDLTLSFK